MDERLLELGLALPSNPSSIRLVKNLNSTTRLYKRSTEYKLICSAAKKARSDVAADEANGYKRKRSFNEACVQNEQAPPSLFPLSSWNDQPNDDDHDDDLPMNLNVQTSCINVDKSAVGWPPINNWRRNFYQANHDQENMININDHMMGVAGHDPYYRSKSMFVKVKMEGAAIGRKIDLSVHHSYQTLENALIYMFGTKATKIVYQDKEGDWLLVGNAPWRNFIQSVQRLKILPNN